MCRLNIEVFEIKGLFFCKVEITRLGSDSIFCRFFNVLFSVILLELFFF